MVSMRTRSHCRQSVKTFLDLCAAKDKPAETSSTKMAQVWRLACLVWSLSGHMLVYMYSLIHT